MSTGHRSRITPIPDPPALVDLLVELREADGLVALDSATGEAEFAGTGSPLGGVRGPSLVAIDPLPGSGRWDSLDALRVELARLAPPPEDPLPDFFAGGFLGALAYELGMRDEALDLPPPAWPTPAVVGGLYVDYLCYEPARGRATLVLAEDEFEGRPPLAEREARWRRALARARERASGHEPGPARVRARGPLRSLVDGALHEARVERARAAIAAGEVYQLNLARRFERELDTHPTDLYRRLRALNPAPFMAYAQWGGRAFDEAAPAYGIARALLSASPELLLDCRDGRASTRPIKGTTARLADPALDRAAREALVASDKERAELAMIVDLERNDLGRVARAGGVRVDGFPRLMSFATVHHLVADVHAELRPGVDALDVLAALFPGGSITGAPKARSMEWIAELEGLGRGFFTGSFGLLDRRGRALFNILIRTLEWRPLDASASADSSADSGTEVGKAPCTSEPGDADPPRGEVGFHVGGGITWRSRPGDEELETRWKGAALAAACSGEDEAPETLGVELAGS